MSLEYWKDLIAATAVVTTVLQFLTGILICQKIVQKGSTGDTSVFPFICGFLSCSLWLRYAFLTREQSVILVNTIGATLQLAYIVTFYVYTINKTSVMRQFLATLLLIITSLVYAEYEKNAEKVVKVMGIMCCCVTVTFFGAPLTMLFHVIRVKSSESLPFPIILASFLVSGQWFIYGILIQDTFIQIPNFLGCLLSVIQLTLFCIYPAKKANDTNYLISHQF
uniref:Sugar transporter SWEET n=1 Tax=Xenopsylla cheopis TaxID=163159 RepID=A0A6M2DH04_XENCH